MMMSKASAHDADVNGGADDERSEADGMSGAMSPEATSGAVVGRLMRGKVLKTDARTRSARRRSASSSEAPELDGGWTR